jgi:hypothetical protein
MAPANPVPFDSSTDPAPGPAPQAPREPEASANSAALEAAGGPEPVSQEELNAWRRGFTPQAEIWNGRLAMVGLSMGLAVLLLARLAGHAG